MQMCSRFPVLVSLHSCRHLLPVALTRACVLLPIAREVYFVTCWLRRAHPLGVPPRLKSTHGVALCCWLKFGNSVSLGKWRLACFGGLLLLLAALLSSSSEENMIHHRKQESFVQLMYDLVHPSQLLFHFTHLLFKMLD